MRFSEMYFGAVTTSRRGVVGSARLWGSTHLCGYYTLLGLAFLMADVSGSGGVCRGAQDSDELTFSTVPLPTELRCEPLSSSGLLTCAGGVPSPEQPVTELVLCDWDEEEFDPRALQPFSKLLTLAVHAEHDPHSDRWFTHVFPTGLALEVLNVSRLGLVALTPPGLLENLGATLRELDLSHNHLVTLAPSDLQPLVALQSAAFQANPWRCSLDLVWLLDSPLAPRLADLALWTCGPQRFSSKPLLAVLGMMKTLRSQCPSYAPYNCSCELRNVVWGAAGMWPLRRKPSPSPTHSEEEDSVAHEQDTLIPFIMVNCSARGLYRLPPKLPVNTTTLLLGRNMISDLRPLVNNDHYRRVLDVFLEHNQVRSIAALEGSDWLSTFRVFSLRGNQLSQLPTYALDHAFLKNRNLAQLYLGNNPWACNCMFTPGFQDLLAKYQSVIRDVGDIRCAALPDDENSQQPIRELSRSVLCQEGGGAMLSGLDLLNAALALLIVLVLGKLAYDYWAFKTSGRLPWLVAKMP